MSGLKLRLKWTYSICGVGGEGMRKRSVKVAKWTTLGQYVDEDKEIGQRLAALRV